MFWKHKSNQSLIQIYGALLKRITFYLYMDSNKLKGKILNDLFNIMILIDLLILDGV